MKKKDIILFCSAIFVALVIFIVFLLLGGLDSGEKVVVKVNGEIAETFSLDKDGQYKIDNGNGGYNLLVIEGGKVYVSEASCPDKVCVNMGSAQELKPIVCLPNNVVISVEKE